MSQKEATTAPVETNAVETTETTATNNSILGYRDIIAKMIREGGTLIKNNRIKNVNVTQKDNHVMVSFTLTNKIKGFIPVEEGSDEYVEGMTNIIFTSLPAVLGAMKEDEDLAWMANSINKSPNILNLVLNGASINIIQELLPAGVEYFNPFSTKVNQEARVYDHDTYINNVLDFKLSRVGGTMADKIANMIIGEINL